MTTVAVLGTGVMGRGISLSLLRAKLDVRVWNRTPERAQALAAEGAKVASTVGEAVSEADVIIIVAYDGDSVLEILNSAAPQSVREAVWVQTATIGAAATREVAILAKMLGIALVETMMTGSAPQAEAGDLVLIGAGAPDLFEKLAPVTAAISKRLVFAGESVGAGTALKLAANSWIATAIAGIAQAIAIAESQGVDPRLWLSVIAGGTADSPFAHAKGHKIIDTDWAVQFAVEAMRKDIGLIAEIAIDAGLDTGLLTTIDGLFRSVDVAGHAADDISSIALAFNPQQLPTFGGSTSERK